MLRAACLMLVLAALGEPARASTVADPGLDNPVELFAPKAPTVRPTRAYTIADALARRAVVSVQGAPDRGWVAVQIERPRRMGERYVAMARPLGDTCERRSDLLVLDIETRALLFDTRALPDIRSVCGPVWAPQGRRLAFVAFDRDGVAALAVWDAAGGGLRRFPIPAIRQGVPLLGSGAGHGGVTTIAWAGEDAVVLVAAGARATSTLGPVRIEQLQQAWRSSWAGEPSVRVTSSRPAASCRQEDRLLEINLARGTLRVLAQGPVKAASVAPNGRDLVVVKALPRRTLAASGRKLFPPQANLGDNEPDSAWSATILSRADPQASSSWISEAEGPVSPDTAPRWSSDGRRLVMVSRKGFLTSQGPAALITRDQIGRSRITGFATLTAAELAGERFLAGLPASGEAAVEPSSRPAWASEPRIETAPLAGGGLAVLDRSRLFALGAGGKRLLGRVEGARLLAGDPGRPGALLMDDGAGETAAGKAGFRIVRREPGAKFEGLAGDYAIFRRETNQGTEILAVSPDGGRVPVLATNRYMAEIEAAVGRPVSYQVSGELRTGRLYLPTRGGDGRPRVIVTAYPSDHQLGDSLSQLNRDGVWPLQTLLAQGFAVFVADFRAMASGRADPLSARVVGELSPALAALRQESDVDAERVGFYGYSYGGVTALTLLGRTDAFAAIVASAPLADFSQYGRSTQPELAEMSCAPASRRDANRELEDADGFLALPGPISRHEQAYAQESPLRNLGGASTPTLVVAGEFDVFSLAADQVILALAERDVPAELALYRAETHSLEGPGNIADAAQRIAGWFRTYLGAPDRADLANGPLKAAPH